MYRSNGFFVAISNLNRTIFSSLLYFIGLLSYLWRGRGPPCPTGVTRLASSYTVLLVDKFVYAGHGFAGGHARVCMSHHRLHRMPLRITPYTITHTLSVTPFLTDSLCHRIHIIEIALNSHCFLLMVRYRTRVRLSHPNIALVMLK